jgi:hypothetical protein
MPESATNQPPSGIPSSCNITRASLSVRIPPASIGRLVVAALCCCCCCCCCCCRRRRRRRCGGMKYRLSALVHCSRHAQSLRLACRSVTSRYVMSTLLSQKPRGGAYVGFGILPGSGGQRTTGRRRSSASAHFATRSVAFIQPTS